MRLYYCQRSILLVLYFAASCLTVCGQSSESYDSLGKAKKPMFRPELLPPKIDSLEEVIVQAKELRPRFRGDTLVYNTSHIQLRPNANVEELLGLLPGLHIGPNGDITYNGEPIRKLLVDGEDMFSSDPTLVTRNFDASKIASVQLLDRKSDRSR